MKTKITLVALIAAALTAGCQSHKTRITEDMPGWNCKTMGNHICGNKVRQGLWVAEVTDNGRMLCWETTDGKGEVYLNLCKRP